MPSRDHESCHDIVYQVLWPLSKVGGGWCRANEVVCGEYVRPDKISVSMIVDVVPYEGIFPRILIR